MLGNSMSIFMALVGVGGLVWPQAPAQVSGREPAGSVQNTRGELSLHTYGNTAAPVGQVLRPDLIRGMGGAPDRLEIAGGESFGNVHMVWGFEPAHVPLPWGDAIRVSPIGTLMVGQFDLQGTLSLPIDSHDPRFRGAVVFLQFLEPLEIDPYSWPMQSTPGLRLGFPGSPKPGNFQPDIEVRAALAILESQPPQYEVHMDVLVPSSGYRLVLDHVKRHEARNQPVEIYATLVRPAEGKILQPILKTESLNIPLGTDPGCEVQIHLAQIQDGVHYLVPPLYELVATIGSCTD